MSGQQQTPCGWEISTIKQIKLTAQVIYIPSLTLSIKKGIKGALRRLKRQAEQLLSGGSPAFYHLIYYLIFYTHFHIKFIPFTDKETETQASKGTLHREILVTHQTVSWALIWL